MRKSTFILILLMIVTIVFSIINQYHIDSIIDTVPELTYTILYNITMTTLIVTIIIISKKYMNTKFINYLSVNSLYYYTNSNLLAHYTNEHGTNKGYNLSLDDICKTSKNNNLPNYKLSNAIYKVTIISGIIFIPLILLESNPFFVFEYSKEVLDNILYHITYVSSTIFLITLLPNALYQYNSKYYKYYKSLTIEQLEELLNNKEK